MTSKSSKFGSRALLGAMTVLCSILVQISNKRLKVKTQQPGILWDEREGSVPPTKSDAWNSQFEETSAKPCDETTR